MSFSFRKNSNPVLTENLVEVLRNQNSFEVINCSIGQKLAYEDFFDILNQSDEIIGFVFFKKENNTLEILCGKYGTSVSKFTDYVLANIPYFIQEIDLDQKSPIIIENFIKVTNSHFDYLLEKAYEYGFKGQFDESKAQIACHAKKMREDASYGQSIYLIKTISLLD